MGHIFHLVRNHVSKFCSKNGKSPSKIRLSQIDESSVSGDSFQKGRYDSFKFCSFLVSTILFSLSFPAFDFHHDASFSHFYMKHVISFYCRVVTWGILKEC